MKDGSILVFDSGIGGLTVLSELTKLLKKEHFIYFGDNGNAPYGSKDTEILKRIITDNCKLFKSYRPKALVCACNTLSADFLPLIESETGVKTFGVFPPVFNVKGKTLLIATERTCKKYEGITGLDLAPMKYLAKDIENNVFDKSKIDLKTHFAESKGDFHREKGYYDAVILGCTHYLFLKSEIIDHFCPKQCLSGGRSTAKAVASFLKASKSLGNNKQFSVKFIGDYATHNRKVYEKYSKKISNL